MTTVFYIFLRPSSSHLNSFIADEIASSCNQTFISHYQVTFLAKEKFFENLVHLVLESRWHMTFIHVLHVFHYKFLLTFVK